MPYTLDQIREIISPIAKKYGIRAVWVFGSYARGEATETSDVDLVIDDKECTVDGFDYIGMLEDIREAFVNGADVVDDDTLHMASDRRGKRRFRKTVLEERVKIYDVSVKIPICDDQRLALICNR